MTRLLFLLLASITFFQLSGCATNPVTGSSDFVLMSEEQEIALGRQNHQAIIQQMGAYDDPQLNAYVQAIGKELARYSHRPDLVYRFTVLDTHQINAFALPGGYIYITRGLLAYLNSEAELAAVLGHEIGHVTARHSVRQHSAATATGVLGAVIAGTTGVRGAGDLANIAGTALVRGYGREHELEADRLGAEYLARSGYEPDAMLKVIGVLKNQEVFERNLAKQEGREPNVYHGVFSTHPDNDRRLQEVVQAAETLQPTGRKQKRQDFLAAIDGLVFGDSAREGIRRGNRFYHLDLDLTITFPAGWKLENHPDRVEAIAPERDGLIRFSMTDINKRISPRQFIEQRLNVSDLQSGEAISHNGMEGYTGLTEARIGQTAALARIVVLYRDDKALIFTGVTEKDDTPYRYDTIYLNTVKSFHPLTAAEKQLAQPQHIHIITADSATRFARLAQQSNISNQPEAKLRLLNDYYPAGQPRPGERIKIVK